MEFELNEDLLAVRDLAEEIFTDNAQVDRIVEVEQELGGFDARLWSLLADAGLLGIPVAEEAGGAGMGMLGLVALLEQQGAAVAPVPLWATLATAALPLAHFGNDEQVQRWLPGLLDGSAPVTGAFDAPFGQPAVLTGLRKGEDLCLEGEVLSVPAAAQASAVVVPVRLEDGEIRVVVVPLDAPGVELTPLLATSQESSASVRFVDVIVPATHVLAGAGEEIVAWTRRRARVALAAVQLGVCGSALRRTAEYTSQRVQFGRPLSTNQAVAVRAADAYLDTEAIRLTTYKAAWLLDSGEEEAAETASLVAKHWASAGGLRVVHATQHLHGGIGADIDYPIHRYFLWGRQVSFTLGSADATAAELGDRLEDAPAIGTPA